METADDNHGEPAAPSGVRIALGRLEVDAQDGAARLDGAPLTLGKRAFAVLCVLMDHPMRLVTKADLIEDVWDGLAVSDAVLTTAMRELRQALGDDPRRPVWIKTEHGRGYRFIAPVEDAPARTKVDSPALSENAAAAGATSATLGSSAGAVPASARPAPLVMLAAAGLVVLAGLSAWLLAGGRSPSESVAPDRSVAVLSFETRSGSEQTQWIADGLAEEITGALTRVPDLRVSSRRAVIGAFEPDRPLDQIAAALGSAHLLDGSVDVLDDRVRISVALVKADDGVQLWSERYDRPLDNVLSLQAEISAHVADTLDTALDAQSLQRMAAAGTQSIAAYEAYLRARAKMAEFSRTGDGQAWRDALPLLDRARSIDPDFAEAHAASALVFRYLNTPSLVMQRDPVTGEAYRRQYAERLDAAIAAARTPVDAQGYRAVRDMELFNLEDARTAFEAYVQARPNDIDAGFDYSNTLVMLGLHEEARSVVRRLAGVIPRVDASNRGILVQHGTKSRDFALAAELAREALADHPFHGFTLVESHGALLRIGDIDAARDVAARIEASEVGSIAQLGIRLHQLCADGDREAAAPLAERLSDHPQAYITAWHAQRAMGDDDAAYGRLLELDRPGPPAPRLRTLLVGDPGFDAGRFPHLSQAILDAGGQIPDPAPALVRCPPAG